MDDSNILQLMLGTGVSAPKQEVQLYPIVKTAIENGIRYFDTAPSYKTERILGSVLHTCMKEMGLTREELFIQSKIDAWQMQDGNIEKFVEHAMCDMQVGYFDSLLVHWPVPEYMNDTWEKMIRLKEKGKVRMLGICNVRIRQLHENSQYKVKPDVIQIERNPLRVCHNEIDYCHENGLLVQSYSPLCKMHPKLKDSQLVKTISEIKQRSIGQVLLRWHIDTGVMPIFTSTKPHRIEEYSKIYDFSLSEEEIRQISRLNEDYKMYLESVAAPGF